MLFEYPFSFADYYNLLVSWVPNLHKRKPVAKSCKTNMFSKRNTLFSQKDEGK